MQVHLICAARPQPAVWFSPPLNLEFSLTHYPTSFLTSKTLSHFVPHEQPRLVVWLFRWEHRFPSLSTWRYSPCLCTLPLAGKLTVFAKPRSEGRRSWSRAPYLPLRCRPLRTMRPPPPTVSTELQWDERSQGAFGTTYALLGRFHLSVAGPATLCGQPSVLVVCGGQFRFGTVPDVRLAKSNAGKGGNSKPFDLVLSVLRGWYVERTTDSPSVGDQSRLGIILDVKLAKSNAKQGRSSKPVLAVKRCFVRQGELPCRFSTYSSGFSDFHPDQV
jgi:hypothetical protein